MVLAVVTKITDLYVKHFAEAKERLPLLDRMF